MPLQNMSRNFSVLEPVHFSAAMHRIPVFILITIQTSSKIQDMSKKKKKLQCIWWTKRNRNNEKGVTIFFHGSVPVTSIQ